MTSARWARIRQLFDDAKEQPPSLREQYLESQSTGDDELRAEALAMLRNEGEPGALLDISLLGRALVRPAVSAYLLAPGQILAGRYRIVRPIGAGGMGEVYQAEDLDLGAIIAIKTMRLDGAGDLVRFKREIQLARTVTHPNVCRIFDLHTHHGPQRETVINFLTMEFIEGETLSDFLARRGPLSPAEVLPLAEQIAYATAAAHAKGVVHRDLKARNVIVTENGAKAVVTDFGLAHTFAEASEHTLTIVGTPAYMAPEQFESKPATPSVDIYAFGVLLYEMVVGKRPFAGDSPLSVALAKIRSEPPRASDSVPSLPALWSATIQKCLRPRPEDRFSGILDVIVPLRRSVDRRRAIHLSRWQRHSLLALLAITVLLGIAIWRFRQSTHQPPREAVRLFRLGMHAHQLGMLWKATQFYEEALQRDPVFLRARASLAVAWLELDQPWRAKKELQSAAATRPEWQRVDEAAGLAEQAAWLEMKNSLGEAATLYRRAAAATAAEDRPEMLYFQARADAAAGNTQQALATYMSLRDVNTTRCPALLAAAAISFIAKPAPSRLLFRDAHQCFESAGDLDGTVQAQLAYGRTLFNTGDRNQSITLSVSNALTIAQSTGNVEQEIAIGALLSEILLETGDDDTAYGLFSRSMQLAERHGLTFLRAQLLLRRAEYHLAKGDYLQFSSFNQLGISIARSGGMARSVAAADLRAAGVFLRMQLPIQASNLLNDADVQLRDFPDRALQVQLSELRSRLNTPAGRPEESIYAPR